MAGRLEGRVAIVTGGGHGIGKAYARGLAGEGASVVVAEIDAAAGDAVAGSLVQEGFQGDGRSDRRFGLEERRGDGAAGDRCLWPHRRARQ